MFEGMKTRKAMKKEYLKQMEILASIDCNEEPERYAKQQQTVGWYRDQVKKLSPDAKLAAVVTVIVGAAPYVIEKGGHLAGHLKTKVQVPKIWK